MANDNLDFYFNKVKRPPKEKLGNLSGYHSSSDFMDKLSSPEPYQMPETPANPMKQMEAPTGSTTNLFGTMTEGTPMMPPPTTAPATAPQKPADKFSDYWKTPVVGKMPLDRFVQMAGMISASLDPDSPMGRMGGSLFQMGGLAAAERARREEKEADRQLGLPEEALRMRLLSAQVGEAEKPKRWKEFSTSLAGQTNPDTGKPYTIQEIEDKWLKTGPTIPKEPETTEGIMQDPESKEWWKVTRKGGVEKKIRPLNAVEIEEQVTGKYEEKKPDQFALYHKEQKALGKTDTEIVEGFKALGKEEKKPDQFALYHKEQKALGKTDTEIVEGFKLLGKEEITPSVKESRAEHFIKNYGPTRNKFDQIIEINPKQRVPRLSGWLKTREIEAKNNTFSTDELNQIEQSIMTGLNIEPKIQDTIRVLRQQGATEKELQILLKSYLEGK